MGMKCATLLELNQWNNAENVIYQNESKEREEVRNKAHELMANNFSTKIVAHK